MDILEIVDKLKEYGLSDLEISILNDTKGGLLAKLNELTITKKQWFKNEWRLARSNCESLPFINQMLADRNTFNGCDNAIFKHLVEGVDTDTKEIMQLDVKSRTIKVYGRIMPVFDKRNSAQRIIKRT